MYRIYKIFDRKQLKVVKISDKTLLVYLSILVLFDIIIMAAWQGVSPLQPITKHIWEGVLDKQYTQCNVASDGMPYVVVLGCRERSVAAVWHSHAIRHSQSQLHIQ